MSLQKRELLVFGYVRLNCNLNIPNDIIMLFNKWMNNALYINIDSDLMKEFRSKTHNEAMKDSYIVQLTDEICVECKIYPNGLSYNDKVLISMEVPRSNELDIVSVNVYVESECEQIINSIYKEIGSIYGYKHYQTFTPFSRCIDKERLSFIINIELISITETIQNNNDNDNENDNDNDNDKEIEITKYMISSPIFESQIKYKWIIKDDDLNNFKNCKVKDWFFSPNFGNGCLSFFCSPNGFDNDQDLRFGVEFHKLPNNIDHIAVNIKLKSNIIINDNGDLFEFTKTEEYICRGDPIGLANRSLTVKMLQNVMNQLIFEITIDIISVWIENSNGDALPKSHWTKYNII